MGSQSALPLRPALDALKTSLIISTAANVALMLYVSSLFEGTSGFCDAAAEQHRAGYGLLLLFQLLVNVPSLVYYHQTDKAAATGGDDGGGGGGGSADSGIGHSFLCFALALAIKLYTTLGTVLTGALDQSVFIALLGIFLLLAFAAYVLLERFARRADLSDYYF